MKENDLRKMQNHFGGDSVVLSGVSSFSISCNLCPC